MEMVSVRTALSMHFLLVLFWNFRPSAEQDHLLNYFDNKNVIDLLKASNISHPIKGISKVQGSKDGVQAWKFRKQVPQLILPQDVSVLVLGTMRGSLGFHFVGRQTKHSNSTLIALTSPTAMKRNNWPVLRLVSNQPSNQLYLEYQALPDMKPSYIIFPKGTAFSGRHWTQLALSLETNRAVLFVDCREAIILEKNLFLSLFLPSDLQITFGSTIDDKVNKFVGYWETVKISTVGYQERPWPCPDPQPHIHLRKAAGLSKEREDDRSIHTKPQSDSPYGQLNEDQELASPTCSWKGREVEDGTQWESEQHTSCLCMNGRVTCAPPEGCSYEGTTYNNGEPFSPDTCLSCICENQCVQCQKVSCPQQSCLNQYVPPGECCPTCRPDCEYEETVYKNGDTFLSRSNPCMNCSCTNSLVRCIPVRCPPTTNCRNPTKRPGQCCPTCSACDMDNPVHNVSFFTSDGCQQCTCTSGVVSCTDSYSCSQRCEHGLRHPLSPCCQDCTHCKYHGQVVFDGVSFHDREDPCQQCVCTKGNVECYRPPCAPLDCAETEHVPGECCPRCHDPCASAVCAVVTCHNPYVPLGECCPRCPGCMVDGQWREEGSVWVAEDQPCASCTCVNGEARCDSQPCPAISCQNPCRQDDGCCLTCDRCSYKQDTYDNKDTFMDPDDPCLMCSCQAGTVRCMSPDCEPVTCPSPHTSPGECCPRCSDCTFETHVFSDGEQFRNPSNPCQQCTCLRGQVMCQDQECQPAVCNNPRPGPCCRNNCNGCSYAGVEYLNGMQFSHPLDDCRSCRCDNGNVRCLKKRCSPPQCSQPCMVPEKCCPQCPGCLFNGVTLANGQSLRDPRDPCSECTCKDGRVSCTPIQCPQVQCQNPITQAGECCPVCPRSCHFHDQVYENGAVFTTPATQRVQCSCLEGAVSCHRMPLPLARSCVYKDAVYAHQQTFTIRGLPASSSCMVCTCWAGRIHCVDVFCHKLSCEDQVEDPGACCPRCREGHRGDNI